jgi:hypothetical protein
MIRFAQNVLISFSIGILLVITFSPFTHVLALEQSPMKCDFRMFQANASYQLPYKFDTAELKTSSWVEPDSYLIYSFNLTTNTSDRKTITQMLLSQVSGPDEHLEILAVRPQNGSCSVDSNKHITCNTSYSFAESATDPIDVLVKISGDTAPKTTSSMFTVDTSAGSTSCTNWLQIKARLAAPNPIQWETPYARLTSGDFYIRVGNQKFYGKQPIIFNSSPGVTQTTLEATWHENSVEMRLYLYFRKKDANMWELYEMRTFNGQNPGDWVYYKDSLGNPVTSTIGYHDYAAERTFIPTNQIDAEVFCKSCEFNALMPQPVVVSPSGYSLEPLIGLPKGEIIALSNNPSSSYGVNVVLRDSSGVVVKDQRNMMYQWVSENPLVAKVKAGVLNNGNGTCGFDILLPCPLNHGDITGGKAGLTTIDVLVTSSSSGTLLAKTSFPVKVFDIQEVITNPSPIPSGATLSPEQKELLRVKQDVARLSSELAAQKRNVSSLEVLINAIRQFLNSIFGKKL